MPDPTAPSPLIPLDLPLDLYITPLSGSFAAHLACLEAGVPVRLWRVDPRSKRLDDGSDFRTIAPQGIVPVLRLPDGTVLTETVAVLQLIADRSPERQLAPPWGSPERYRLIEWLSFVATEVHKKHLSPIFSTRAPAEAKQWARSQAAATLVHPARHLEVRPYLLGERFTVADIYLFWALLAAAAGGIALDPWPPLVAYVARIRPRPSVVQALQIEQPLYQQDVAAAQGP